MTFGECLKNAREKKGLTQNELAQLIHVKNNSISNWENDQNLPKASIVFLLSRTLGVSIECLIGHYSMNDVEEIGLKPFKERSRYEKLVYDIFHEYASDIGAGLKAAGGSLETFTDLLDEILSDSIESPSAVDPQTAIALQSELRGIMSGYNSLNDEGKDYVKQSLKIALAAYSKKKGE